MLTSLGGEMQRELRSRYLDLVKLLLHACGDEDVFLIRQIMQQLVWAGATDEMMMNVTSNLLFVVASKG